MSGLVDALSETEVVERGRRWGRVDDNRGDSSRANHMGIEI